MGYFVLGPSDLYKLVKEIGKFIQNIRTLGTDLTTTLESNMESQLQLEELRKAQRELNDAFSFRRSINTDDDSEAFSTTVTSPRPETPQDTIAAVVAEDATAAGTAAAAASGKKKIRRRVRRKVPQDANGGGTNVPDLEMPTTTVASSSSSSSTSNNKDAGQTAVDDKYANRPSDPFVEYTEEEKAMIDEEFDKYMAMDDDDDDKENNKTETAGKTKSTSTSNWYSDTETPKAAVANPQMEAAAQSRFQQQLSGSWNDQIMANEEKLEPLAKVMQLLATLEEEKIASTKRLEEEFRKRAEMEEEYYQKQRKVLEEAANQVQQGAATATAATSQQSSTKAWGGVDDDSISMRLPTHLLFHPPKILYKARRGNIAF